MGLTAIGEGRFRVEARTNAGALIAPIPYSNLQGTWFMGDQGMNISFTFHFRNLALSMANFYPAKAEIWIWDDLITTFPIFAGPITQLTPGSDGVMSVQASDPLWYLTRRVLTTTQTYVGKPEAAISSLVGITQALYTLHTTVVVHSSGTQNISAIYANGDLPQISDLIKDLQDMGDGVDFFFRNDGGSGFTRQFHLYGGKKTTPNRNLGLVYPGGALKQYSLQLLGTGIANTIYLVGNGTGLANFGFASSLAKTNEYLNVYQAVDDANQNTSATLNAQAATELKRKKSVLQIPSIVVNSEDFNPFVDFDFADLFLVRINDDYVQFNQSNRVVGWQATFGPNDNLTTVIYTNNTEEIT